MNGRAAVNASEPRGEKEKKGNEERKGGKQRQRVQTNGGRKKARNDGGYRGLEAGERPEGRLQRWVEGRLNACTKDERKIHCPGKGGREKGVGGRHQRQSKKR
jgi:hypothetical protein